MIDSIEQHTACCDRCGNPFAPVDEPYPSLEMLHHDLAVSGWTFEGDVLCEACTAEVAEYEG